MTQQLLNYAHDGAALHEVVKERVYALGRSLNALALASGVAFSTFDRWRKGSRPQVATVLTVERTLTAWHEAA